MYNCIFDATDKPAIIYPKNSHLGSSQKRDVLTSASGPLRYHVFGWSKWPCIAHGHSASCFFFIGSIAEPKVNLWSEATLRQLSQDWLSVIWTSTFPVLFTTTDFTSCKSGVPLFSPHWDTVSYYKVISWTLCFLRWSANVQHCLYGISINEMATSRRVTWSWVSNYSAKIEWLHTLVP